MSRFGPAASLVSPYELAENLRHAYCVGAADGARGIINYYNALVNGTSGAKKVGPAQLHFAGKKAVIAEAIFAWLAENSSENHHPAYLIRRP